MLYVSKWILPKNINDCKTIIIIFSNIVLNVYK